MRVLIIRPGALGDSLLAFPILRALRQPASHITFVSNGVVLPLAQACGLADVVDDFSSLRWSGLFSSTGITSLGEQFANYDLVVCWLHDPDGIVERNLAATDARRVVVAPGRPARDTDVHIVDYLAQSAGVPLVALSATPLPLLPVAPASPMHPFAIHPGSGGIWKCWPPERFAAVITALAQRSIPVLLLAGPADQSVLQAVMSYLHPAIPQPDILSCAPLLEVAQRLLSCRGYLGNDAGITHLAALLGISTLALFGPTSPQLWHPFGAHVKVLYRAELVDISVEDVLAALEE